jgi:uncharacterized protein
MVVEFSVANFKSIRHKQTLSLQAAKVVSRNPEVDEKNVFTAPGGIELLKSAAIFGPNASGKSNIVKALAKMLHFIDKSFQDETRVNTFTYFALDQHCAKMPIHFELIFITNGNRYRYGFQITDKKVSSEWLFGPANTNEVEYFTRVGDQIDINKARFKEGAELPPGKTKATTLFLNVVHAFNGPIAGEIKEFFFNHITVSNGLTGERLRQNTLEMMENEDLRQSIAALLRSADLGIEDINNVSVENLTSAGDSHAQITGDDAEGKPAKILGTIRTVKNATDPNTPFLFRFDDFESEGTKKLFTYSGQILDSLILGNTLVIDELDAQLHPSLTRRIVELFNSAESNPANGQLVFVTHDINLLDPALLRRDQIYFTEKGKDGETSLYSLVNIGGVRNDASYEKDYMKGKYGALPYLAKFNVQPYEQDQENR